MTEPHLTFVEIHRLHQAGELEAAKAGYLSLLQHTPHDPVLYHMLAIVYAELDEIDQALAYLEQAVTLDPGNIALKLHRANLYKRHGLFNKAVQGLQAINAEYPDYAPAYNNLGTVYFAQAKFEEAIAAYLQAVHLKADYTDAYYNLGLAYLKAGQLSLAENALQAVLQLSSQHAGAYFQLASLMMQTRNFLRAIEYFNALLADHPNHFESQTNIATCYLQAGSLQAAKEHYQRALTLIPHDAQVLFNLGVICMQENQIAQALRYYQELIAYHPNHFQAHNNLAITFLFMRDKEQALKHFQQCLRIAPQDEAIRHTIRILMQKRDIKDTPREYVANLFNSYSGHYDAHMTTVLNYHVPEVFKAMVMAARPEGTKLNKVLDLGCGTGLCAEAFKSLANSFVGVDLAENMLLAAEKKGLYEKLITADVGEFLQNESGSYDLVMAGDVIVYFGDIAALLAQIKQVLVPGGYCLFNAEISLEENFYMTASGRFAHHKAYLDHILQQLSLQLIAYQVATLRTEAAKPVRGHFYLLQKV